MITIDHVKTLRAEFLSKLLVPVPKTALCRIILSNAMRTVAGRANGSTNMIKLNVRLLNANPGHVVQTVGHELAHLVAIELYGWKLGHGHGDNWKSIMRQFGLTPKRTHNLDTSAFKRKHNTLPVYCNCKIHNITQRQFTKLIRGVKFSCKLCKSNVRLNKSMEENKHV